MAVAGAEIMDKGGAGAIAENNVGSATLRKTVPKSGMRICLFFDIFLDNDLSDNQYQRKNEKTLTFCSKIGRLCCYFSTLTTNLICIRVSENVAPSSELN